MVRKYRYTKNKNKHKTHVNISEYIIIIIEYRPAYSVKYYKYNYLFTYK